MDEQINIEIGKRAPKFKADAFHNNKISEINLQDYKGKWIILLFYPADFTFICPTELGDLADKYEKFKEINVEVLSISTDTVFVHKAWHDKSQTIKKINFPMVADPTTKICRDYGTYIEDEGLSTRATVIIDPDGIIKTFEMNDNSIGRNTEEVLRKVQAAQFVREHRGEVCPVNWKEGDKTLKPGLDLVGEI